MQNQKKISLVYFGTPQIAVKSLEYFINSEDFEVVGVVTQPDRPKGRGHKLTPSPVKEVALEHNIPVFQPISIRKEPEIQEELKKLAPDFFVTFAFGQILSEEVLAIPKFETINLHASLLPKYRGAAPIQRAIINGDEETGICTMITELGLDCGDICIKHPIKLTDDMNCEDLAIAISDSSPELLDKTLKGLYDGSLIPVKQTEDCVCIAKKVTKEECKIDWSKSAKEIHNLIRGVYNCPCAYFEHQGKTVKVMDSKVIEKSANAGEFIDANKNGLEIGCGEKALLINKVKPEGKGVMSAADWYRGLKK